MPDWREFCRGAEGLSVEGEAIDVVFPDERRHRVRVRGREHSYDLSSIVAREAALEGIADAPLKAWRRNRVSQLVGFRLDKNGRLWGEAWVPKAGLDREEFLLYVRRVASACDLFEYQLTGKDRE